MRSRTSSWGRAHEQRPVRGSGSSCATHTRRARPALAALHALSGPRRAAARGPSMAAVLDPPGAPVVPPRRPFGPVHAAAATGTIASVPSLARSPSSSMSSSGITATINIPSNNLLRMLDRTIRIRSAPTNIGRSMSHPVWRKPLGARSDHIHVVPAKLDQPVLQEPNQSVIREPEDSGHDERSSRIVSPKTPRTKRGKNAP